MGKGGGMRAAKRTISKCNTTESKVEKTLIPLIAMYGVKTFCSNIHQPNFGGGLKSLCIKIQ